MKHRARHERGQGLIEFAVVFPLLVFFLMAIFDVGLGFNRQATLQHAAREGARYAALSDSENFIKDRTADQSQGLLDDNDDDAIKICYEDLDNNNDPNQGDAVYVEVRYTYEPFALGSVLGFWGVGIDEFDIHVVGSSRIEANFEDPPNWEDWDGDECDD